jgi:hypothetical protein
MQEHPTSEIGYGYVPTPCVRDHKGPSARAYKGHPENLSDVEWTKGVPFWPTPTASEVTKIPATANYGQKGLNNHPRIRGYPTREKMQKDKAGFDGGTKTQQKWPTPKAHDPKSHSSNMEYHKKRSGKMMDLVCDVMVAHGKPAQLNPPWVEWLMGWPIGWTDLKPLGMDKCQLVRHSHGVSCRDNTKQEHTT